MLNQEKMPGAGSVADTIDFMKQMWGSMGAPSMMTPSLSVDDINKKISDLKTVASWLELNLNMLKATIQTLEVQSATLSTLQAMSAILASREGAEPEGRAGASAEDAAPTFPFGFPLWPGAAAPAGGDGASDPEPQAQAAEEEDEAEEEPQPPVEDEPPIEAPGAAQAVPPPDFQSAMANPNAWWNVLQEQFKHAVGNAIAGARTEEEPLLKPSKPAAKAAKPPKTAKRSGNKTVAPAAKPARPAAPKAKPARASGTVARGKPAAKPASAKPAPGKVPKNAANTSASARAAVVQSRQNKKPAPRKPTSP
ncbi:PhaM family polyhydroxyalkanoate granule multifunctional regulatory protein [Herbaspirillum robiniae]|uniref:PhaM family polyhydroxyalkanoate granule multifunctional regulatory protein n=1 Tax=Herbaspirillum robiniae TaxID=2014887 RepID=UPI003D77B4B9